MAAANIGVFVLSFLLWPIALGLAWMIATRRRPILSGVLLVLVALGLYARFVEPHRLLETRHAVRLCGGGLPGTLSAAVLGDTHHGVFGNAVSMDRLARRLNDIEPDLVLMPGDLTYYPKTDRIAAAVAPLGTVQAPVYAVLGNHDVGLPGPDLTAPLTEALEAAGVTVLYPGEAVFEARGTFLRVAGLRDLYEVEERGLPLGLPERDGMATVLLQHNPDAMRRADIGEVDLMVAGHTHGGQVYLPGITCAVTFACDTLRYGAAQLPPGQLFVTSGTGMTGLPIRFMVPPRIDVLDITVERCDAPGQRIRQRRDRKRRLGARQDTGQPRDTT